MQRWEWAPDLPTLLPEGHNLRVIMAGRRLVAATPPLVLTIRAAQVAPADPGDPVITPVARVAQVDLAITPVAQVAQVDLVDLADPAIIRADLVDLADPAITPVARADPAITPVARAVPAIIPVARAVPAARGTGTPSVVTSAGHRGAMGLAPGGLASRRGRHGIDRSPRLVGAGTTARSITGVTTKRRIGTPVSTSGDLTSSECGSRCDR